mmetsp:Transcript_98559/g.254790  ORF Transcript_98559/g.254790 Transcript_98559/m.254790 type:complete len:206 (-) Transcript_98559:194-811(-)
MPRHLRVSVLAGHGLAVEDGALLHQWFQVGRFLKQRTHAAHLLQRSNRHPEPHDDKADAVQTVRDGHGLEAAEERVEGAQRADHEADLPQRDVLKLEDLAEGQGPRVQHHGAEAEGVEDEEEAGHDRARLQVEALTQEARGGDEPQAHVPRQQHIGEHHHGAAGKGLPEDARHAAVAEDRAVEAHELLRGEVSEHQGPRHNIPRQ